MSVNRYLPVLTVITQPNDEQDAEYKLQQWIWVVGDDKKTQQPSEKKEDQECNAVANMDSAMTKHSDP